MLILIIGGSGSGKSACAEKRAMELAGDVGQKYYLATMAVHDEEMKRKVQRHQQIRAGKGWLTLEYPVDIRKAAGDIDVENAGLQADAVTLETVGKKDVSAEAEENRKRVVLLEDLGNLVANEMFRDGKCLDSDTVCNKISEDIAQLLNRSDDLIVVSNQVFSDGIQYDAGTEEYIRALGKLHQKLTEEAAEVTEVVVGIPVQLKKVPIRELFPRQSEGD